MSAVRYALMKRWGLFTFRLIAGCVVVLGINLMAQQNFQKYMPGVPAAILTAVITACSYLLFIRVTERSWPKALQLQHSLPELLLGVAIGILLCAISVIILLFMGVYRIVSIAPSVQWIGILLAALPVTINSSVVEELLVRGILMRQLALTVSP